MAYEKLAGRLLEMRMVKSNKPKGKTIAEDNPYAVRKVGSMYHVVKKSTGEVRGKHATREKALRQFRLLEMKAHQE